MREKKDLESKIEKPGNTAINFFLLQGLIFLFFVLPELAMAVDGGFSWPASIGIGDRPKQEYKHTVIPSPGGGAVVVWTEEVVTTIPYTTEVRAQWVDSNGNRLWGANGIVVSNTTDATEGVAAIDTWLSNGGLIVAWKSGNNIYAQRLNSNGQKQWNSGNGVLVFSNPLGYDYKYRICGDGWGGAYIGWQNRVVYIDPQGNMPYGGVGGIEIAPLGVTDFSLISDGSAGLIWPGPVQRVGGAYAAWFQLSSTYTIQAQRIVLGDTWAPGGVAVSSRYTYNPHHGLTPRAIPIAKDSNNNLLIAWSGWEGSPTTGIGHIRAQKLDKFGAAQWAADGVVVMDTSIVGGNSTDWWLQFADPDVLSDGSGGAFLAWNDYRDSGSGDIYAQRLVSASGAKQWAADGVRILTAGDDPASSGSENFPKMVNDGVGGVVIVYHDYSSWVDIAATRLDMNGVRIWSHWLDLPPPCVWQDENCDKEFQIVHQPSNNSAIILTEGKFGDLYVQKFEISNTPPVNDACANAEVIPENLVGSLYRSLYWATNDGSATDGNAGQSDIWFRFTASSFGTLRLKTCGTNDMFGVDTGVDTVLSLHSDCPGTISNQILSNDDWQFEGGVCTGMDAGSLRDSSLVYDMSQGQSVLIRLTRYNDQMNGMVRISSAFEPIGDHDGDGYTVGQGDCNDNDNTIYPGAPELCDGKDNDCSGGTTDGSGENWYGAACDGPDTDSCKEGIFNCSGGAKVCSDNTGNAVDICDGIDNDCNPATADGSVESWYGTSTTCGTGECSRTGQFVCSGGVKTNTCVPGVPGIEICDGKDNNCNGQIDEGTCFNTPSGQGVPVSDPSGNITVTFGNVTQPGNTTFTTVPCGNSPWEGFTYIPADNHVCVEIETTAAYQGGVKICIKYDDTGLTPAMEQKLVMIHCDDQGKCSSIPCNPLIPVDTVNNVVCGCTTGFSTFGVGFFIGCQADLNNDGSVDGSDVSAFIDAYGTYARDPEYVPGADFDGNGRIDQEDLDVMAMGLGKSDCPIP